LAEECARLRLERADERRRREAAEREVAELRRRLRVSADEVRLLKGKCEVLEADLLEQKGGLDGQQGQIRVLAGSDACGLSPEGQGGDGEGQLFCEAELEAIESAVERLCLQREALTGDVLDVRQRLLAALDGSPVVTTAFRAGA